MASSRSARRSSITAPIPATSMRWLQRCLNSVRGGVRRMPAKRRSGGGVLGLDGVAIQKLLLIGDEFPGFLQRLIQVAAQNIVVDAFDHRPCAGGGGDDIADQIEIG